jgi:hypothetical protein
VVFTVEVSAEVAIANQYTPAAGFVAVALITCKLSPAFTVPGTVITTGDVPPPLAEAAVVHETPVRSFTTQPEDGNVTGDWADTVIVPTPLTRALVAVKAIVSVTFVAAAAFDDWVTVTAPTAVPIATDGEDTTAPSPDVLTLTE